ncbi:OstA-like protein [Flavobacterium microcysteis]|uniref:OstA-like protein n=1 Tax=Flavobacterium microcysteis TaxID=2596891 RepID=A0A501QM96_9FLAO|nr:OstA-like protein [Flavobacterium microcysteis]TPD73588.1 OstA-like protein [Flavobacterium microcysteis]
MQILIKFEPKFNPLKKNFLFLASFFILLSFNTLLAQAPPKKIIVENSDFVDIQQEEIPGAIRYRGNVRILHDGVRMTCNTAYLFQKENYIKAFGDVKMNQGDTVFMDSRYAEYQGNIKFAFATGDVVMRDPKMTLTTDTINFDRRIQQAYYTTYGTIKDQENTLRSKSGRYYLNEKKFQFLTAVTITNPKYVIKSNHLDYYSNSGHSYLFGPSTITSKENFIYTEKGFYDTKKNFAHFVKNSYIKYDNRLIEGDSLYYDRNREFASATNNVKVTDSINKGIVRGHYGEVYRNQDSLVMTKRAVAATLIEKDTLYIHGKKLMVTGKPENRVMRAFNNVRFYKIDMSGKCDSLHSNQKNGLTQLIGRPVIWNGENQLTGKVIHLISNPKTEKLDSLKVLTDAFIASKDTLGTGYNQVKGVNLYGKFRDNKLYEVDLVKNTEKLYYGYDKGQLAAIDKGISSSIHLELEDNKITTVTAFKNPESESYPEKDLPENARKLRGFIWRGDEIIKSKDDIFPPEENEIHEKIVKQSKVDKAKEDVPMEVRKETLDYDKKKTEKKPEKKAKTQ